MAAREYNGQQREDDHDGCAFVHGGMGSAGHALAVGRVVLTGRDRLRCSRPRRCAGGQSPGPRTCPLSCRERRGAQPIPGEEYGTLDVEGPPTNRPAEEHPTSISPCAAIGDGRLPGAGELWPGRRPEGAATARAVRRQPPADVHDGLPGVRLELGAATAGGRC